jgi:hypothetical protein
MISSREPARCFRTLIVLVAAGGACLAPEALDVSTSVASVEVVPASAGLVLGATLQLRAIVRDKQGDIVTDRTVQWTSDHPSVAPVTRIGIVTALAVGVAVVTATSGGKRGASTITVTNVAVAAVTVIPESLTMQVGGSAQLQAVARAASGDTLKDRPVTWSSTDTTVARTYGDGMVTGVAPGVARIAGTIEGKSDTAVVTIVPPGAGPWPNEPRGFTVISDQPWSSALSLGWTLQFGVPPLIVPDAAAPLSPPDILQITYPTGFVAGSAPSTMIHSVAGKKQLYIGTWWKPSNPWQGQAANVNKIQYVFTSSNSTMTLEMYGSPGGPYELRVYNSLSTSNGTWLVSNVIHVPVTLGEWHKIEWLLVENTSTTPANGLCRWWLDGKLIGDYTGVLYPAEPFDVYKIAPVWGGIGGTKTETDYFWFDHTYLSGK